MTENKSRDTYKAMLETGFISSGETIIDRPIEEVWAAVQEYYNWSPSHLSAERTTIKGEHGKVGEVVEIRGKEGAPKVMYAETLRINALQLIEDSYRVANIAWKVYDEDLSFSVFSDLVMRECQEKTILRHSLYTQRNPASEEFLKTRRDLLAGKDEHTGQVALMNGQITEYIRKRESSATRR